MVAHRQDDEAGKVRKVVESFASLPFRQKADAGVGERERGDSQLGALETSSPTASDPPTPTRPCLLILP